MNEYLRSLKTTLLSPGDLSSVGDIETNHGMILEALETEDIVFTKEEEIFLQKNSEWTATVYNALAGPRFAEEEPSEIAETIANLRNDEYREIENAFSCLIQVLPSNFSRWSYWFERVKEAPRDYQEFLQEHPSVECAGDAVLSLTEYGLEPLTFHSAARGLERLFNRVERATRDPNSEFIRESGSANCVRLNFGESRVHAFVPKTLIEVHTKGIPELPGEAVYPLLDWLFTALTLKPFIISGYIACFNGPAIPGTFKRESLSFSLCGEHEVRYDSKNRTDLIGLWCRDRP